MKRQLLRAAAALLALALAACAAAPAQTPAAATAESAAPAAAAAPTVAVAGAITPRRQDDGDTYYSIEPAGPGGDEGVICQIGPGGVQTPVCGRAGCQHDGEQCPAWLPLSGPYQLAVLGGRLCLVYMAPDGEELERTIEEYARLEEEAAAPAGHRAATQAARRALIGQPCRIEYVDPGGRTLACQLGADTAGLADRVSWNYTDDAALYGTLSDPLGGTVLLRWGLDGTLTEQEFPWGTKRGAVVVAGQTFMGGSRVLYAATAAPVDLQSMAIGGSTALAGSLHYTQTIQYRLWDLATGEDRPLFTYSAAGFDPIINCGLTQDRLLTCETIRDADGDYGGVRLGAYPLAGELPAEGGPAYALQLTDAWYTAGNCIYLQSEQSGPLFAFDLWDEADNMNLALVSAETGELVQRVDGFSRQVELARPEAILGSDLLCSYYDGGYRYRLIPCASLLAGSTEGAREVTLWEGAFRY